MAHSVPPARDPAPALSRGIRLLQLLQSEGACSLEHLTHLTRWPKSSVARLLRSLELCTLISRDEADRRYRCRVHLVPVAQTNPQFRQQVQREMADLCRSCQQTVELHQFDGTGLVMIDRHEPEDVQVRVVARIGFHRDLTEADSLAQVTFAFGLAPRNWPKAHPWVWNNGTKQPLPLARLRELVAAAHQQHVAVDLDINGNGVRRYAAPLLDHHDRLLGALAIAQSFRPGRLGPDTPLTNAVQAAGRRLSMIIATSGITNLS